MTKSTWTMCGCPHTPVLLMGLLTLLSHDVEVDVAVGSVILQRVHGLHQQPVGARLQFLHFHFVRESNHPIALLNEIVRPLCESERKAFYQPILGICPGRMASSPAKHAGT